MEDNTVITMYKWEDNTKMDITEIGYGAVDWIHLSQDTAHAKKAGNYRVP
jgi:hypothetical protein